MVVDIALYKMTLSLALTLYVPLALSLLHNPLLCPNPPPPPPPFLKNKYIYIYIYRQKKLVYIELAKSTGENLHLITETILMPFKLRFKIRSSDGFLKCYLYIYISNFLIFFVRF